MMSISDLRFAAALTTDRGKVHLFDSIECLTVYELKELDDEGSVATRWVSDFVHQKLVPAESAILVRDESIRSPMAAGLVAFTDSSAVGAGTSVLSLAEMKRYVSGLEMMGGGTTR